MTYEQYVGYAVYAAKQVLPIFEKKYPSDKKPRKAINAAVKCIKNPTKENKAAAADAYAAAVYAANNTNNQIKMRIKILKYGLKLLK